jgi:hypothetical protein
MFSFSLSIEVISGIRLRIPLIGPFSPLATHLSRHGRHDEEKRLTTGAEEVGTAKRQRLPPLTFQGQVLTSATVVMRSLEESRYKSMQRKVWPARADSSQEHDGKLH